MRTLNGLLLMLAFALPVHAANIQPNAFAWGENVGWLNFAPTSGPGVTVGNTAITGFAWSENFGWVNFAPTSGGVVNNGAGVLSGFAWSENAGWINFLPTGAGGVTINTSTGQFSGFAWGENVGWINFSVPSPVITTWRPGAVAGTGVASRKLHGAAGNFDLPLALTPANPTVEPRQGPTHTIVFTYDNIVVSGDAAVTLGTGLAGTPTFNGNEMTVVLTGVADAQYVTLAVSNIGFSDGSSGLASSVRIGFLLGDVNQSRVVTVGDMVLINAQLGHSVSAANFLTDVNANGLLAVSDLVVTNINLGRGLAAP